jgi:hypothetical protein
VVPAARRAMPKDIQTGSLKLERSLTIFTAGRSRRHKSFLSNINGFINALNLFTIFNTIPNGPDLKKAHGRIISACIISLFTGQRKFPYVRHVFMLLN